MLFSILYVAFSLVYNLTGILTCCRHHIPNESGIQNIQYSIFISVFMVAGVDGERSSSHHQWVAGSIPAPSAFVVVSLGKMLQLPFLLVVVRGLGGAGAGQPGVCQRSLTVAHHNQCVNVCVNN